MKSFLLVAVCLLTSLTVNALPKHSGNSRNTVLQANGETYNLNLSGSEGQRGNEGREGSQGQDCTSGDAGGDGEDGGTGEYGGNVLAYVTQLSNLKNVKIQSLGGPGGPGGKGGRGGKPSGWESCNERGECHFVRCGENSDYGRDGRDGSQGSRGQNGNLYLVMSTQEIPKEVTYTTANLKNAIQTPIQLTEHEWQRNETGALALLAPGSNLADDYFTYMRSNTHQFKIIWAAQENLEDFPNEYLYFTWLGGKASVSLGNRNHGVDLEVTQTATETVFIVKRIIKSENMGNLKLERIENSLTGPEIVISDLAGVSDLVTTDVRADIDKPGFWSYKQLFTGKIPSEALVISKNEIRILLNKLGIKEKDLKGGTKLVMELSVGRLFGAGFSSWRMREELKVPKIKK